MSRTLAAAAAACRGALHGEDRSYGAVSTDSRTLGQGDLFVALKGPRFDGHEFLDVAARAGAAGAIVARLSGGAMSHIVVPDTLAALSALAHQWRGQFEIPVIGVAGSNGKTTVKEMTAAILCRMGPCLATRGNLNNHIGVPLTLMRLEAAHRSAVIEIGANHPGEVTALAALARPRIGLITNAGAEHLEGFGDLDGVARAEGEMVAALPVDGVAVINADDVYAPLWRQMSTAGRVVSFGLDAEADFRASDITQSIEEGQFALRFTLHAEPLNRSDGVTLRLAGLHNVRNALAAAAAAQAAGATFDHILDGLQSVQAVSGRLQLKRARGGAWLIDDSYNANPGSVLAALEVLAALSGEKWMVLADMGELGAAAADAHREAGELARRHGVKRLFAAGELSVHAAQAFGADAHWFADVQAMAAALDGQLHVQPPGREDAQITVLIKGSRFNRLERVVAALVEDEADEAH